MKLSQYQADVNRNTLQGKVANPVTLESVGGDVTGSRTLGAALGQGAAFLQQQWQKDQNDRVFDAINDFNQQNNSALYDEKEGLFNTMQGKNAEGLQEAWEGKAEKIRQDVIQKYHIDSEYAMNAFKQQVLPTITSTRKLIDRQQRGEMEKYTGNQSTLDIQNTGNMIAMDPGTAPAQLAGLKSREQARAAALGIDPDAFEAGWMKTVNGMARDSLDTLSQTGDYENGLEACNAYDAMGADKNLTKRYRKVFNDKHIAASAKEGVKGWYESNKDKLRGKTPQEIADMYKADHPIRYQGAGGGGPLEIIGETVGSELGWDPSLGFAVAAWESGRGKSAPGNNYFGIKWNGEGDYTESETEERDENGNYYTVTAKWQKYDSPEDSAMGFVNWIRANCTPEEIASVHSATDLAHLMKVHGYYTDDEGKYASNIESISHEYSGGAGLSDEEKAEQDETYNNSILGEIQDIQREVRQRNQQKLNNLQQNITSMEENGASAYSIQALVQEAGADPDLADDPSYQVLRRSVIPRASYSRGGSSGGTGRGGKAGDDTILKLEAAIESGDIRSEGELASIVNDPDNPVTMTLKQYNTLQDKLEKTLNGEDYKIQWSKGQVEANIGRDISDSEWNIAKTLTRRWAVQYKADHDQEPTDDDLFGALVGMVNNNIDINGSEYNRTDLDAAGIYRIRDTDDPDYKEVTFSDGYVSTQYVGDVWRLLAKEPEYRKTEANVKFEDQGGMM